MSSNVNKQEFRQLIERQFLPYVVKPARFLASEWRAGAAENNAPLAVIVSGASYESSLGSPLASAVSEALIDSRLCDVGWLYQFSDQASERLFSIGAAPFVTPQLVRLADAKLVIAALSRPSDIFSALKNLDRSGMEFAKSARLAGKKGGQPEFIAVTDNRSCFESLRQEVFGEVFDRVYSLDDLLSALENMSEVGAALAGLLDTGIKGQSERLYFPACPPGPVIEISQNRARFRFSETSARLEQTGGASIAEQSVSAGESIADAILDSGQTEFQLERCNLAGFRLDIATLLDKISADLTAERYRVTLTGLSPGQIGSLLPGALRRYRRARVDIKLPSLSDSVNKSLGRSLEITSLIDRIKILQSQENIQVQLSICLGFPGPGEVECEETIAALRMFSQALNPRSGLKIKFIHFTPLTADSDSGASVRNMRDVEALFESIRSKKTRGISLALLDSAPHVLDILIERGAFNSLSSLTEFALAFQRRAKPDSARMTDIFSPYQSYFSAQSPRPGTSPVETKRSQASQTTILPAQAYESAPDFNERQMDISGAFGRGRKRSGAAAIAAPTKTRVRFTWTVSSTARYLSHLDNLRALEGALLRARLPLSYTQGVRPRPKVSFGPPLPVGFTSDCELFDVFFVLTPTQDQVKRFSSSLPDGFEIIRHETVYTKALSILEEVSAADYIVSLPSALPEALLSEKLNTALGSPRLIYRRKSKNGVKEMDLRPGIFAAEITTGREGPSPCLKLTLALTDTFTIRPEDFLQAAGIIESAQTPKLTVHRSKFYFGRMSAFRPPRVKPREEAVSEEV